MAMVDIRGETFRVELEGPAGAPVLMLSNSLSSDLTMWDDQVPEWSRRYRVLRYDQRGHGESVATPAPYTLDQLGQDALGIMDALGIGTAHWCGVSLGGMMGMWMLTHAPERIGKAVLANTSAYMGPRELWDGRIRTAERGGMEALVDATIERWFPAEYRAAAPATMDRTRAMILGTSVDGYCGCCAAIRDMDQRETIRAVTNPVLVVLGEKDPATPPKDGELIANRIAGARTVTLDAGHISNVEQSQAFTQTVLEFLR